MKRYAKQHGISVPTAAYFYDKISGTAHPINRPKFQDMLEYAAHHEIDVILFDEPSRIARDLLIQEVIFKLCKDYGFKLIAVQCPDAFDDGVVSKLVRHVVGAVSEFNRSEIVARLKHARDQKARTTKSKTLFGKPKVTGKKSTLETRRGTTIKKTLQTWIRKATLKPGDISKAQKALTKSRILTEQGNEVSLAQVTTWLNSLRSNR